MITLITAFSCNLVIAALAPAKVSEVETNRSAEAGAKAPTVIYVRTFTMSNAASKSENAAGEGRPRLLGALRGGEENTVVGRHREAQQEEAERKQGSAAAPALVPTKQFK